MVHALPRLKPGETQWDTRDGQYRCVWRGRRGIAALVFLPAWCLAFQSLYAAIWISGAFDATLPTLAVVEERPRGWQGSECACFSPGGSLRDCAPWVSLRCWRRMAMSSCTSSPCGCEASCG